MLIGLAHLALSAVATIGVVVWWARASRDGLVRATLAAGLVLRLVPGLVLFAISDAHLPVAQPLQLEPGFWFYAPDGVVYYHLALGAAAEGLRGIWTLSGVPSVFYVRILALALTLFGASPATSLLLNLWAYVGLATVILAWSRRTGAPRGALLVALAATSLMPSWLLWSYQPLKDSVFLLCIGLYFFTLDRSYTRLSAGRWSGAVMTGLLACLVALVYALAGIRWYYAVVVVGVVPLGVLATLVRPPRPSWSRLALACGACVLLAETLVPGAGPDLPWWIRAELRPTSLAALVLWREDPASASTALQTTLDSNVQAAGGTLIQIAPDPHVPASPPQSVGTVPLMERWRATLASMLLLRALARRLGHVAIGGGRGLWAFADLDTIAFDATLLASVWVLLGQWRRGALFRPVFWPVLGGTVAIALLLATEIANFGTLFRMRAMITVGLALLPLTVSTPAGPPALTPATDIPPSPY